MAAVAGPLGAVDADVVLAIAIPVPDNRMVPFVAELCPQVVAVPAAVAAQIEQPLAPIEDADLVAAVAVEVSDDGNGAWRAEDDLGRFAVRPGDLPRAPLEAVVLPLRQIHEVHFLEADRDEL